MGSERLLQALRLSVAECVRARETVAVANSGGLDSSVIAALAKELAETRSYICAVEGSPDALEASGSAPGEGSPTAILLSMQQAGELVKRTARLIHSADPVRISYTAPIVSVLEHAREDIVLAGNGADELFGGYAKYLGAQRPEEMMVRDLDKALDECRELREISRQLAKEICFPYLSQDVMAIAKATPVAEKIAGNRRKVVLREVAATLHLPTAERPKKAAQFSSGILRSMERLARADDMDLKEWCAGLVRKNGRSH